MLKNLPFANSNAASVWRKDVSGWLTLAEAAERWHLSAEIVEAWVPSSVHYCYL